MNKIFFRCVLTTLLIASSADISSALGTTSAEESAEELLFAEEVLTDEQLGSMRGAFNAESLGIAVLQATTVNNAVTGGNTGSNFVSQGGLSNAQGVVSLIQNSGNNVIIQSATIVNLTLQP